jgi:hypothetical protein
MHVWIRLADAETDAFAKITCPSSSDTADVATLACSSLAWNGLRANQIRIYLVTESGLVEPSSSLIADALLKEPLLLSADILLGSWLVAKPTYQSYVMSITTPGT